MSETTKLDIFAALGAVSRKDFGWYATLSDDHKRQLQPYVLQRWIAGSSSDLQVMLTNEFMNGYTFSLQQEKELLWKLACACGSGNRNVRYKWSKAGGQLTGTKPLATKLLAEVLCYSPTSAAECIDFYFYEQLLNMAWDIGWDPDDITKLKKELKDHPKNGDNVVQKIAKTQSLIDFD